MGLNHFSDMTAILPIFLKEDWQFFYKVSQIEYDKTRNRLKEYPPSIC